MTREEAVDFLSQYVGNDCYTEKCQEAHSMAVSTLRPVSREQVEKAWRGCEKCNGAGEYSRYAENLTKILLAKYCPHCGRPLTDEAVDMVMERLEGME